MRVTSRFDVSPDLLVWASCVLCGEDIVFLEKKADLYLDKRLSAGEVKRAAVIESGSCRKKMEFMLVILSEMTGNFIYDNDQCQILSRLPERKAKEGYIYCATNPSLIGLVKIGMTTKTPEERLKQLSKSPSIPDDFVLEWSVPTNDTYADEIIFHNILSEYRYSKEFFKICPNEALRIINRSNVKTR